MKNYLASKLSRSIANENAIILTDNSGLAGQKRKSQQITDDLPSANNSNVIDSSKTNSNELQPITKKSDDKISYEDEPVPDLALPKKQMKLNEFNKGKILFVSAVEEDGMADLVLEEKNQSLQDIVR